MYNTMLAKESIFYRTHSVDSLPVNFFFLLKVMIYVLKYRSFLQGSGW